MIKPKVTNKVVEMLLKESVPVIECHSGYSDAGYNDSHSDSGGPGWGDQWNDGSEHSDSWSDQGSP